jgi:hypothetical protein
VNRRDPAINAYASVDYAFDGTDPWPEPDDPKCREFFEARFGFRNKNLLFYGRSGHSMVAIMIRSAKADSVVATIAAQAKEAAAQCTGKRPALIALHLIDEIDREDLEEMLKVNNELHAIMREVLKNGKRGHVDSLVYTVPQQLQTDGRGAWWLSGRSVILHNPEPLFPCDPIRSIFRPIA